MNTVTSTPAPWLWKRKAKRSASEVSWCSRHIRSTGSQSTGTRRQASVTPR